MGPSTDKTDVVDPQYLKVYGIKGLRVADASIIKGCLAYYLKGSCRMINDLQETISYNL